MKVAAWVVDAPCNRGDADRGHIGSTLAPPKWLARLANSGRVSFNATEETAGITLCSEGFGALWDGGGSSTRRQLECSAVWSRTSFAGDVSSE
jgi:hypothetical protein